MSVKHMLRDHHDHLLTLRPASQRLRLVAPLLLSSIKALTKRRIAVLSTFAVLLVSAITLISVCSSSDAGLIDGVPQWEHSDFPLTVSGTLDGHPVAHRRMELLRTGVRDWNSRLGFPAFKVEDADTDVRLTFEVPAEPGWEPGGHSELRFSAGKATRCDISTTNVTGDGDVELLVIEHELGHCLGLAHDKSDQSIMRPVQHPTPPGAIGPWVSDQDRRILQDMYML